MKRVLIVSVGNLSGGIERYTILLGKMLSENGYNVYYALRKNSWLSEQIISDNVILLDMDKNHLFSSMFCLKRYVEEHKINIIHCNSNNGLFVSLFARETKTRKKIGVIHGDVIVDQANKRKIVSKGYVFLENLLLKRTCSMCIAVSKSIEEILVSRGIPRKKIEVVYTGIEFLEYNKLPEYFSDELKICSVGNLLPVKNHISLLHSLLYLKKLHPEVKFSCDIYGDGGEKETLLKFVEDNELGNVNVKGFDLNIRSKLNQYTLYIHPSLYESFGLAILEAMNAGCCVIANRVGGVQEIIDDNSGYLIDISDENGLAELIFSLYKNRTKMNEIAIAGKKRCKEEFSIDKMFENIMHTYNAGLGENIEIKI